MSATYPLWSLTNYPDTLDKANANIRQDIVNFEDRTSSTAPLKYYILSNDVKSLQQSVFAIQETLGVMPQSTFGTVNARLAALEDYTDLDVRYGGPTWRALPELQRPTIMGHLHDGSPSGASKVDLVSHITGLLPKTNINLNRQQSGLTGADITLSSSTDQTILSRFDDKFDKVGGAITGATSIDGNFNSNVYKEADAYAYYVGATGTTVTDNYAFSGTAIKALSTNTNGNLLSYATKLRYGYYSLGLRVQLSTIAPGLPIGRIHVLSGTTEISSTDIIPNKLTSTDYEMIYVAFSHKYTAAANAKTLTVTVEWYGTTLNPIVSCNMNIDSIVITPMHVAVYDKNING